MQHLKIATWNLERVPAGRKHGIADALKAIDADIFILTETHRDILLDEQYHHVSTLPLSPLTNGVIYKEGELRASILSKFPIIKQFQTANAYTSVAAEFSTPLGNIAVLGCIIGILGRKQPFFDNDLSNFEIDVANIFNNANVVVGGDFNFSFRAGNYVPTKGSEIVQAHCDNHKIRVLTQDMSGTIDHILASESLIKKAKVDIVEWNQDFILSDHKGICAIL